jgi:hypothetical protein
LRAKRSNVSKADAQAKKRYRPAQQGFDTELHARLHRRPRRQRVKRYPNDKRDHHARDRDKARHIGRGDIADGRDDRREGNARSQPNGR